MPAVIVAVLHEGQLEVGDPVELLKVGSSLCDAGTSCAGPEWFLFSGSRAVAHCRSRDALLRYAEQRGAEVIT